MKLKVLSAVFLLAALSGCNGKPITKDEPNPEESLKPDIETTIWVDHHKTWVASDPFNGYGKYIYRISSAPSPDFSAEQLSTAEIIDFSYEQGYTYKLRVKERAVKFADGLNTQYRLVAIEDKQLATEPFELEIPKYQDFINTSGTIKFSPGSFSPAYNCLPEVCSTIKAMPNREDIVLIAQFTDPSTITLISIKSIGGVPTSH